MVEDVSGQLDYHFQGLVQEVALESELELSDVLSGDPLLVQLEQLLPYYLGVNVRELDRQEHLAVPVQLLEHLGVAVLEGFEYLL